MKFMKLGNRPDTFYTQQATRSIVSDVPSDLVIRINNVTFHLHKFLLLPKCGGLLQGLSSGDLATSTSSSSSTIIDLHDIPGGEEAFELCAKFCYGITINLSANNFVPAFCAAKFLQMSESVDKGNLTLKLEAFFNSCILEGWKDSIVTLQSTVRLAEWSQNLGIVRKCIDSIVEKVLTPPVKVTWSYTYTRPGFIKKSQHPAPKDWWTEDISDLDIDLFRCVITAIRSAYMLPPQLIGEALHVYACRWLPECRKTRPPESLLSSSSSSSSSSEDVSENKRKILENIVSMIPADKGSVSVGFLLRLLSTANYLGANPVARTELTRRSSLQLEEATVSDLLLPSHSPSDQHSYAVDLVLEVIESFSSPWRRLAPTVAEEMQSIQSIRKIGKLVDSYLQVVARDINLPVMKFVSLAESLPAVARKEHDDVYKAINTYLKAHPELSKGDKKSLCRILDCQKLSPEVRAHAVKNERLPLRTVVQVLFFEQEKGAGSKLQLGRGEEESSGGRTSRAPESSTPRVVLPSISRMERRDAKSQHRTTGRRGRRGEIEEIQGPNWSRSS